ncbi:P-loop containing nucleoside triphosphate hydrolase protein [Aspergillus karnatakaensis]|uniref:Rho family protein n=1 Tax=Aspergillus karnatakaensis TaxID=1810916 RepID=UPI003CCD12BC
MAQTTTATSEPTSELPVPSLSNIFKCVVIGDPNIGKTTLLIRYTTDKLTPPTELPAVCGNQVVKIGPHTLSLFDTHHLEEDGHRLKPLIYPETDVLLLCFSLVRGLSTLENAKQKWLEEIQHFCPGTPFILVGLQKDLRDQPELGVLGQGYGVKTSRLEKVVSEAEGRSVARRLGVSAYVECSSVTGEGVGEVFLETALAALRPVPEEKMEKKRDFCVVA